MPTSMRFRNKFGMTLFSSLFVTNSLSLKLYNYIVYNRSLTNSNWTRYKIKTYLENLKKVSGFLDFVGHKEWSHGFLYLCLQMYKSKSFYRTVNVLLYYISHLNEMRRSRYKYPTILKQKLLELKYMSDYSYENND